MAIKGWCPISQKYDIYQSLVNGMLNIVPNNRGIPWYTGIPNFIEKTGDSFFLGDHISGDLLFWKNVDMTNMITGLKTNTHKFRLHTVKIRGCSSIM